MQLVVFSHGGEQYALPIAAVSEIIRHATPRSVASGDPGVRGVIGLRGKIIPILDLADRLGLPPALGESGKIVILDTDRGQVGVIVDDVDEVVTVADDQLDDVPTAGDAIDGVAKLEDRLVMLLDATSLYADAAPAGS